MELLIIPESYILTFTSLLFKTRFDNALFWYFKLRLYTPLSPPCSLAKALYLSSFKLLVRWNSEIKNDLSFERDSLVKKVTIACFDDITYEAYLSAIAEIFKEEKGDEVF